MIPERGRKRGRQGEGGREGDRQASIGSLLHVPQLGIESITQACALTGDQTYDLSVCRMTLQPTESHQLGSNTWTSIKHTDKIQK